jgi:hypothetical protein
MMAGVDAVHENNAHFAVDVATLSDDRLWLQCPTYLAHSNGSLLIQAAARTAMVHC